MSAGETRWSRIGAEAAASNNGHPASKSKDRSATPQHSKPKTNAWANRGSKAAAAPSNGPAASNTTTATSATTGAATVPAPSKEEGYTPINAFNSEEVKSALRGMYESALAGDKNRDSVFTPTTNAKAEDGNGAPKEKAAPWGQKPSQMAGGQDFWVVLRRQVREGGALGG